MRKNWNTKRLRKSVQKFAAYFSFVLALGTLVLLVACQALAEPDAGAEATNAPTATFTPAPDATATPLLEATAVPPKTEAEAETSSPTVALPLFDDTLRSGWQMENSWAIALAEVEDVVKNGRSALAITPDRAYAGFFLSVADNQPTLYRQQRFLGITFWLNPGDTAINPDEIALALTGSNQFSYWSRATSSAPQDDTPFTAEIPLHNLGLTDALPANTWTPIEFWFQQAGVPAQTYITGFYLKTNLPDDNHTFFIDDVALVGLRDITPPVPLTATNLSATTVIVTFNEDLDPATAVLPQNYAVNGRTPSAAIYDPIPRRVTLSLAEPLSGSEITVTINGVTDQAIPANEIVANTGIAFTAVSRQLLIDVSNVSHPISPYIYGMAMTSPDYLADLGINLHSWGGNANERYNWELGNAWNAARDWLYKNGNYGHSSDEGSIADTFIQNNMDRGIASLLTIPMVGWVAGDTENCAFPLPDGSCGDAAGASCDKPGAVADPASYSVAAPPQFMADWLTHLNDEDLFVPFISLGNEPLIWGTTHYDVHPNCTSYDEYLGRYISYAEALRDLAPDSQFIGPNSCCWWFYWNSMNADTDRANHDNLDFLPWFLREMATYEAETGVRLLDVLGIHYYPAGLYSDDVRPEISARRVRSTRSLWDPSYVDESWIGEPVNLIPRMQELVETYYPGTEFGIGEWNWGADQNINGAVTIADVLGIYGRSDLYYAAYWTHPAENSPGYYAFKMYTNFDDAGGSFGGAQPLAIPLYADDPDALGSYAALDGETNTLYVMLINKQPDQTSEIQLSLANFAPAETAVLYQYDETHIFEITAVATAVSDTFTVELPPYAISLLVIPEATE